ncbi:ABC transporter ATP-binding protein [Salinicoccus sp. ID82-1]|uniref:ABC transporter ATP-binding protein n=1 Tax=Salinicoccus cyprini TaxID=2493691 RepID=A0A558AYA6_9STAP|nr:MULTISPECIES: ABC transporter ATP-binding protein [Salinicoccus]MCG1008755.1 ABC transporter ATP-binding protein [Salinicoccus sp. ID82-1]TVT29230.1 ABC transporter ATP-binding protein [Salinicoccus cyprini]
MLTVYKYALKYKWFIIVALFFMFIELAVELLQPYLISKVIDDGIVAEDIDAVWFYLLIMFGISMAAFISGIINSYFSSQVATSFSYDIRTALFRKVQYFTLATLSKFPTSSLITRMTQDVLQTEMLLYMSLRIILRAPLLVIGSLIMSFVVNPTLGFYLSFLTPVLLIFLIITARKGGQIFLRVQKRLDRINRFIQQNLEAVRLIKANDRENFEISKFSKVAGRLKDDTIYALRLMESIMPVLLLIINGSLLVVLWMASDLLQNNNVEVGEVVAVINYALRMQGGFSMFAFIIIAFSRAKASSERMEEVLVAPITSNNNEEIRKVDQAGTVKFENVSFKYPGSTRYVLRDINFEVKENETLVIMGGTGSGKSTLLSLIPKMYDVKEGDVYINGINAKDWNEDDLRETIGYVPQSAVLFSGSIFENLLWGDLDAGESEVFTSTQKAQIHNSINTFDHRYETRVGQRGVTLSGGQKQRLSIARALVRRPGILILDDSTSALDIRTESALWDAIKEENTTQIIVTQKVVTAKMADRILILDGGEISALGPHDTLMQESSLYRSIVQSQTEGGQLDD